MKRYSFLICALVANYTALTLAGWRGFLCALLGWLSFFVAGWWAER